MRKKYLEENKPGRYSTLLLTNELMNHLFMIQEQAANRMEILINQMKQSEGVTEELKSNDQILWVQMMKQYTE